MNVELPEENVCRVEMDGIEVKVADKEDSPAGLVVDVDGADGYPVTVDLSQFRGGESPAGDGEQE